MKVHIITKLDIKFILLLFSLAGLCSCDRESEGSRKASLLIDKVITADAETDALKNRSKRDDAADDPAIWINPQDASQSRIIGTDKKGGLALYNLQGKEIKYYPDGKMNNVDVRQNFQIDHRLIDIAACSNRTTNTIDFYRIDDSGILHRYQKSIPALEGDEIYGFCLAIHNKTLYAFANSVSGKIEQWKIELGLNTLSGKMVRKIQLESKTEGMAADDELGVVFIGEESKGIWKTSIAPEIDTKLSLLQQSEIARNEKIYEDIEGVCIFKEPNNEGYLIVSSQGNYSYALFNRKAPHEYIGSFRIGDGSIDGVEETDGIEVTNHSLGHQFPNGMLVVQDGYNKEADKTIPQNFKMIRWEKIANLFHLNHTANNINSSNTKTGK